MPSAIASHHPSAFSAKDFTRFTRGAVFMLLASLIIPPNGFAAPVRGISTQATSPVVPVTPEGGVLMLPLIAERPGDSWPRTLPLVLEDGREITGHVAWIAPAPRRDDAQWTDSPLGLSVRAIRPDDRTSAGRSPRQDSAPAGTVRSRAGMPLLLAELPPDAAGSIRLLNQTLHPRWLSAAGADEKSGRKPAADSDASDMLQRERALDRPDPDHPLEYWRWTLLADRKGKRPPPPDHLDDESRRLTALHTAQLWQVALNRVREHSRGVADHLRDLLTRVCTDGDVPFAAWIADPAAVNALLNILLDEKLNGPALVDRALEWADDHERPMVWLESATEQYARLAIVNPSFRPTVARLRWDDPDDVPIAVELPAGRLTRVRFERQAFDAVGSGDTQQAAAPEPEVLLIDVDERTLTLVLDVPVHPVVPPGVYLPPLSPTLTLASVQQGRPPVLSEQYATTAQVRRLQGRWEVFVECRRPETGVRGDRQSDGRDGRLLEEAHEGEQVEHVAVFIGENERDGEARIILIVPEHGEYQLARGSDHRALRVHRRSYDDRWHCRIVLPDAWLDTERGETTHLGVVRSFADNAAATTPMPAVPWRLEPGRLSFDRSNWDDVPRE